MAQRQTFQDTEIYLQTNCASKTIFRGVATHSSCGRVVDSFDKLVRSKLLLNLSLSGPVCNLVKAMKGT